MRAPYVLSLVVVAIAAAAIGAAVTMSVTQTPVQAQAASRPAAIDGKPNFSGIWQANNEANWDLQAHAGEQDFHDDVSGVLFEFGGLKIDPGLDPRDLLPE